MKPASREVATTISNAISEILRNTKRKNVTNSKINRVCKKYDLTPSWIKTVMMLNPTK